MRFALLLRSETAEEPNVTLTICLLSHALQARLPGWLLRGARRWVDLSDKPWALPGPDGRKGYEEVITRTYGVYLFEDHLNLLYGRQLETGEKQQRWSCFLPWMQWRRISFSVYDADGKQYSWGTGVEGSKNSRGLPHVDQTREIQETIKLMKKNFVQFKDFDGEMAKACYYRERRVWLRGDGVFSWLSILSKPKVIDYAHIYFSREVTPKKNTWKGGILSASLRLLPGEDETMAFKRYAAKYGFSDIEPAEPWPGAPEPLVVDNCYH